MSSLLQSKREKIPLEALLFLAGLSPSYQQGVKHSERDTHAKQGCPASWGFTIKDKCLVLDFLYILYIECSLEHRQVQAEALINIVIQSSRRLVHISITSYRIIPVCARRLQRGITCCACREWLLKIEQVSMYMEAGRMHIVWLN